MSIPYSPLTWVNGSTPALNATNLQRFETALTTLCAGGSGSGLAADTVDGAHLSTNGSLGTSDALVPSEKAVKLYADTKAPIASPTLTGTPAAPTAAAATDTTQIATTAFVHDAIALDTDYLTDFRAWDSTRTYTLDEPTFRNGIPYRSIIANNINKDPELFPEAWEVVGGSGEVTGGVVNFLQNDLTANTLANVTSSGLTSLAWDLTATDILNVGALKAVAPASGTGRYIDIALSDLDPVDVGRTWSVEFSYKLGTNADDLVAVYLYNGSVETPLSLGNLPYAGGTLSTVVATVIPTTTLTGQYLRFKFKDNAAATFYVAKVTVGPQSVAIGAAIGNWISWNPTLVGFGSTSSPTFRWRRVGEAMEIEGEFVVGTPTAVPATFSLPIACSSNTPLFGDVVGQWWVNTVAANAKRGTLVIGAGTNTTLYFSVDEMTITQSPFGTPNASAIITASSVISLRARVNIPQWTSNVNLTSDFTEYASNSDTTNADTTTTSFALGLDGSSIPSVSSTAKTKRVRFSKPIQPTDDIFVEIYLPTRGWSRINGTSYTYQANDAGTVAYGVVSFRAVNSSTDWDVIFNPTADKNGTTWASLSSAGGKWRVRKISNGNMAEVPPVVRAEYTGSDIITPSGVALIQFNTKVEDTHSAVTTGASWKFTAPISGIYQLSSAGTATVASSTNGYINVILYKNGSQIQPVALIGKNPIVAGLCGCDYTAQAEIRLNAGEYIFIAHGVGGNTNGTYAGRRITITRIGS